MLESSELELVPDEVGWFLSVAGEEDVRRIFFKVFDGSLFPKWVEDGGTWTWCPRQVV